MCKNPLVARRSGDRRDFGKKGPFGKTVSRAQNEQDRDDLSMLTGSVPFGAVRGAYGDSTTWFDVEIQIDESYPRDPSTELRRSYCLSASIAMLDWMFTKKDRHGAWG